MSKSTAVNAIVLAAASSTVVKRALVSSIATPTLRRMVVPAAIGAVVTSVGLTFLALKAQAGHYPAMTPAAIAGAR